MIITMLEAEVPQQSEADLMEAFSRAGERLPPQIRESFLAREAGTDVWRVVTVWDSTEALEAYRREVETPGGVLMFRAVGVEPTLSLHDVEVFVENA